MTKTIYVIWKKGDWALRPNAIFGDLDSPETRAEAANLGGIDINCANFWDNFNFLPATMTDLRGFNFVNE